MTTEKEGRENERGEKCPGMGCCSPQMFREMMAKWRKDVNGAGGTGMQKMMKEGCWRPEEK